MFPIRITLSSTDLGEFTMMHLMMCWRTRTVSNNLELANHLADCEEAEHFSSNDASGDPLSPARAPCLVQESAGLLEESCWVAETGEKGLEELLELLSGPKCIVSN